MVQSGETFARDPIPIQEDPICIDDLTPYKGLWVAIKDGHVADSASEPLGLLDDSIDTTILLVPTGPPTHLH
jgi:hypothetical protein